MTTQTLHITFDNDERARKFREICADFCPSASYVGKHRDGAFFYELDILDIDTIELFYWLGKFNNRPNHFSII